MKRYLNVNEGKWLLLGMNKHSLTRQINGTKESYRVLRVSIVANSGTRSSITCSKTNLRTRAYLSQTKITEWRSQDRMSRDLMPNNRTHWRDSDEWLTIGVWEWASENRRIDDSRSWRTISTNSNTPSYLLTCSAVVDRTTTSSSH